MAAVAWSSWPGHAPTKDLPNQWKIGPAGKEVSGGANIQWRTETPGRVWSSAMIDGETLWLTTAIEHGSARRPTATRWQKPQPRSVAKSVTFRALIDARDGQILEDIELFSVDNPQPTHVLNSFASPSPVLGQDRLYCQFGDYGTACVDTKKASVIGITAANV